jgi:hypothetical protein
MTRRKQHNALLATVRDYLRQFMPELRGARLTAHMLDGPPDSPRYAVTAERCTANRCPHGIAATLAAEGRCSVIECPLRDSARLLVDRRGVVVQSIRGDTHWS